MTLRPEYLLGHSQYNAFLFAAVGEEKTGVSLTVLTALTRLGFDPWREAARLSDLPRETAARVFAVTIAMLPEGDAGLKDRSRASKKPIYGAATNKRILALLDKPPPAGYGRWTGPLLAKALEDVDVQYVWRFVREHKIDLAARKSSCESNDPVFVAKAADVVGLYIDPPAKAVVLCVDEKPSIQALERAQGYLKLPNGRALTGQSHDYKRKRCWQALLDLEDLSIVGRDDQYVVEIDHRFGTVAVDPSSLRGKDLTNKSTDDIRLLG
jgi:hypothetical protein